MDQCGGERARRQGGRGQQEGGLKLSTSPYSTSCTFARVMYYADSAEQLRSFQELPSVEWGKNEKKEKTIIINYANSRLIVLIKKCLAP